VRPARPDVGPARPDVGPVQQDVEPVRVAQRRREPVAPREEAREAARVDGPSSPDRGRWRL